MLGYEDIKKCIDLKKFKIINIIKSNNYKFNEDGSKIDFSTDKMDEDDIKDFFDELEIIVSNNDNLCFAIFNESFFSYHLIVEDSNYTYILKRSYQITEKNPNLILIINLCHKINPEYVTTEYKNKLKIYFNPIYDNHGMEVWNVSSHKLEYIFGETNDFYYSNETFVIMRSSILYSYKKATFYYEIYNYYECNYVFGFGNDEINEKLTGELHQISKFLSSIISIEICFDFQKNIKTKTFENVILKEDNVEIKNIKELRKGIQNYSEKKIIIIQSNTTDLFCQINILPLNKIIIKSDPIQQYVFSLKDKNQIEEIKFTEEYNSGLIQKEKNNGKTTEFKNTRLNKVLYQLNSECESRNVSRLINEFKAEKKIFKSKNHQFMFFVYNEFDK